MSDELSVSGVGDAANALRRQATLMAHAADLGVAAVAAAYEAELKSNRVLQSVQNSGKGRHIGPAGGFPNRRTGRLANSVSYRKVEGLGTYAYQVGPGMVYARSLELGNPRWKGGVRYPFMEPTAQKIRPHIQRIFTTKFQSVMSRG